MLDSIDIQGKPITADALLTQRELAHYHFTVKNILKLLLKEIESFFENVHWEPNYTVKDKVVHEREEIRNIRVTSELNHVNFPHVGQVIKIKRTIKSQKSGKETHVIA